MRYFLLLSVSGLILTSTVLAEDTLFPELNIEEEVVSETLPVEDSQIEPIEENEKIAETVESVVPSDNKEGKINRQAKVISGVGAEQIVNGEGDTKEAKEEAEKIFIALNNIKTNVTAVRAVSNCHADFVLLNGFKKRKLENFAVTLTIGDTEKTFNFKNVAPQKPAGEHFVMIGKDCENLLLTPKTHITKCQVQGVTEKKCIEKVNYIALPTTINN